MTLICLSSDDSSEIILLESFLVKFEDFLVFIYKDAKINVVVRKKTESETQDKVAKELGYENDADLQKANEKKLLKDAGLDEEDITGVVNKLVEQRIANDPRFKKIEELEAIERNNFVNTQLKEINNLRKQLEQFNSLTMYLSFGVWLER